MLDVLYSYTHTCLDIFIYYIFFKKEYELYRKNIKIERAYTNILKIYINLQKNQKKKKIS